MTLIHFLIIAALLAGAAAYAVARHKRKGRDIDIPAPDTLRTDLLYGYYGTHGNQIAETTDHVNLVWLWDFLDKQQAAEVLAQMPGKFGVLDVASYLYHREDGRLRPRPGADGQLRAAFRHLRDAGVLSQVKMLVPVDEPNLSKTNLTDTLPWAAELMRRVAADFTELEGVLLGCIYLGGKPMPHLELWDVVGFDLYNQRSGIFAPGGHYARMFKKLRPGQRTVILPGGYSNIQQDPTPFFNFAHGNPEVLIVLPFLWATVPWADDVDKGIRDIPAMRAAYEAAGRSLVGG